MIKIESLLSARLFLQPQLLEDKIYFISNLSGHLSLYAMDYGGSVPEPLLPPDIALQNPLLLGGKSFFVFPKLRTILVMIDRDGDENYQPMIIPEQGGFPQPLFENFFADYRVHLNICDPDKNIIYLVAESRHEQLYIAYQGNLATGELVKMAESAWHTTPGAASSDHNRVILIDGYTLGDNVLYQWTKQTRERHLFYGIPIESRKKDEQISLSRFTSPEFTPDDDGILITTALFIDSQSVGYMRADATGEIKPVTIKGISHTGVGEFVNLTHIRNNRYLLKYNIDGCSWLYEGSFDSVNHLINIDYVICGQGQLTDGVVESVNYDETGDRYIISYSTATSPTQIYSVEGSDRSVVLRHTNERVLGISSEWLSSGEDASYLSFDGTRISARLYLPSLDLRYQSPRPLIYYIHGGPQSQERPDFSWFSMPLIQFLTLSGFAVFVPNVRGSTGYGLNFTKQVDRDWGGKDRLDHVHAMREFLSKDSRIDIKRAGVVGRSYGGYMTLILAGRHPELWSAAIDMFGPYDLVTFSQRIPETWKPYYRIALGDPADEKDNKFLVERSPSTYLHQLSCPLMVIQGKNDPRVVERESRDLVENLRNAGKEVDYLMFENEGHDVLKYENRVTCYNAITNYFKKHLMNTLS